MQEIENGDEAQRFEMLLPHRPVRFPPIAHTGFALPQIQSALEHLRHDLVAELIHRSHRGNHRAQDMAVAYVNSARL